MQIQQQIEQHRRWRRRRAITRLAVEHAQRLDPAAPPQPGARPPVLLAWARAVERALHDLVDRGELVDLSRHAARKVRARYSDSAAWNVPVELVFDGTELAPLCESCAAAPCECEDGPSHDREYDEPHPWPRSDADREACVAAGYVPCKDCCTDRWYRPEQLVQGRCYDCTVEQGWLSWAMR